MNDTEWPDHLLRNMRERIEEWRDLDRSIESDQMVAGSVVTLFDHLDAHMTGGGAVPKAWDVRKAYTREQITAALNAAADMILSEIDSGYENSDTIRAQDFAGALVNAVGVLLDKPGADFETVVKDSKYQASPDEVRDWIS